ncbi:aspartate/glutamate racemase family protein [Marinibacterium profundimaris]|uniref:aspartate/glutamate racemase family protein n=1 Tax=Marinibacterium profundimaris TaxID=1679460 RepID=UPI000B522169|nr:aspartate/glutamate racemase family protein [Marinibacterium profundimaris]
MKIGLLGTAADRPGHVPPELAAVVHPDTQLEMYPVTAAIFAHTPVELAMQQVNYLEAGLRAARDGCDAIVCVSTADYAVAVLRETLDIPVIGAGEAALTFGRLLGTRFSIVTVWPGSTNFIHENNVRLHGVAANLASIRNVMEEDILQADTRPDAFISRMQSGDPDTFARIVASCRHAEAEDGAEYLILGCTCMSPIAADVARECTRAVVNPFATAVSVAETMARSRPPGGTGVDLRPETLARLTQMVS